MKLNNSNPNTVRFSIGNAKLIGIPSLNLLSGYACPGASTCLAKVNLTTGKLIDGPKQEYRCFAASMEVLFPQTRKQRQHNFDLLRKCKTAEEMLALIQPALPNPKKKIIRLHVAGDIFNRTYLQALIMLAKNNPHLTFYTYTKSLTFWIERLNDIPENFKLTASYGGKHDHLIQEHNLKSVKVVTSPEEAEELGLELDHDDSHAYQGDKSFALLIHGVQKAGSEMSKAKAELRKRGITGYQRKNKIPHF